MLRHCPCAARMPMDRWLGPQTALPLAQAQHRGASDSRRRGRGRPQTHTVLPFAKDAGIGLHFRPWQRGVHMMGACLRPNVSHPGGRATSWHASRRPSVLLASAFPSDSCWVSITKQMARLEACCALASQLPTAVEGTRLVAVRQACHEAQPTPHPTRHVRVCSLDEPTDAFTHM